MANICGGADYESVTFWLKGSTGKEKLLSKIFYDLFKRRKS